MAPPAYAQDPVKSQDFKPWTKVVVAGCPLPEVLSLSFLSSFFFFLLYPPLVYQMWSHISELGGVHTLDSSWDSLFRL